MPINLPEEIVNLTDLKQTLFFFVHQNFMMYGKQKTGEIVALVPYGTREELAAHIRKLYKGNLPLSLRTNNLINRFRLVLRGFKRL